MTPPADVLTRPSRITLRDGSEVLVRTIGPEDKDALAREFRALSPETRHQRFMAGIARLAESQLTYFTEIDHHDHEAWIALDPTDSMPTILGVARYVRLPRQSDTAEVAVVVVDSHQRRGLGSALLALLSRSAARNGVTTFQAWTFGSNVRVVGILRGLGAVLRRVDGDLSCFEVPVFADPVRIPDTRVGRAFKAIASAADVVVASRSARDRSRRDAPPPEPTRRSVPRRARP